MYTGEERRKEQRDFCSGHMEFSNTLCRIEERLIAVDKRINGTIDDVKTHIENSRPRNIAIAGVLVTVFIFLFTLAINLGRSDKQIEVNTKILQSMVSK